MNIIDQIQLRPAAKTAWAGACRFAVRGLTDLGIDVEIRDIGQEEAFAQPDGSLMLRCKVGTGWLMVRVDPKEWEARKR